MSFVPSKLVVYLFPGVVDCVSQILSGCRIQLVIAVKSREVYQPVLEQLQVGKLLSPVIHRLEGNKDVELIFDDVLVEQKPFRYFLVDMSKAVKALLLKQLTELFCEIEFGVA